MSSALTHITTTSYCKGVKLSGWLHGVRTARDDRHMDSGTEMSFSSVMYRCLLYLDYIALHDGITDEMEKIWKDLVMI
jgi:hypothetical protein